LIGVWVEYLCYKFKGVLDRLYSPAGRTLCRSVSINMPMIDIVRSMNKICNGLTKSRRWL